MEQLSKNEIHLWFVFPDEIQDTTLLSEYQQVLSPEEKQQWQRFHFEKHRHLYLVARALVRAILSRYTAIPPKLLEFSKNKYGKPELMVPDSTISLCFNLSHTEGLIILGVTLNQKIGVDVEDTERKNISALELKKFFSSQEFDDLQNLSGKEQGIRFFDYWTLKESYIKACGMGLSLPLDQFSFHISGKGSLQISFAPALHDDPRRWQFWLLAPTVQHRAALSLQSDPGTEYKLLIRKATPLNSEQPFSCPILNTS
ncbi:MAG: 4'-phosphopantetheinyl transferase superfamily protein [SAR324 cluster bacterium]|nr:4'-phosphopantetheinyl transferase superfamily protein [SAR324 cluster bacterium]